MYQQRKNSRRFFLRRASCAIFARCIIPPFVTNIIIITHFFIIIVQIWNHHHIFHYKYVLTKIADCIISRRRNSITKKVLITVKRNFNLLAYNVAQQLLCLTLSINNKKSSQEDHIMMEDNYNIQYYYLLLPQLVKSLLQLNQKSLPPVTLSFF